MSQHPVLAKVCDDLENSSKVDKEKNKDLNKTKLCVYHMQGSCGMGSNCRFAHCASELRNAPNLAKTQLCSKFMNGQCFNENCSYAHGESDLIKAPNFKRKMCSWYRDGKCRNGTKCGFAHSLSELSAHTEPIAGTSQKNSMKSAPPGLKSSHWDIDCDASTDVPSSQSLVETDVSMIGTSAMPEENLFRMMAGRGSAPLQNQVASMGLAISDLQAKLSRVEEIALQTQVEQMKNTITQLSEQCGDMEAKLRVQLPEQPTTVPPIAQQQTTTATTTPVLRKARVKNALYSAGKPTPSHNGFDDSYTADVSTAWLPPGKNLHKANASKAPTAKLVRCWERPEARAALGVLTIALMIWVEWAVKQ